MKKILKYKFLIAGLLIMLGSCQKMEYTEQLNWAYPVSGEWTINYEYPDKSLDGPYKIKTYNSSFGQDSIFLEDAESWPFKFKTKVDMSSKTFVCKDIPSKITLTISGKPVTFKDTCTVNNGKVVNNDSIYMEIEFRSKPGKIYKIYGHRRVSYEEYNNL